MFRGEPLRRSGGFSPDYQFAGDLELCMRLAADWDFYYIDEVLSSWRFMSSCHTATLHQTGLNIGEFYAITHKSLDNESVKKMFGDEWEKINRDSMFFCSCRALLNGLAGLRSRRPKLIFDTIKTIVRKDAGNFLRLPLFVVKQIWVSIFPPKLPPPRQ
jgi:hypothetical protein